MDDLISRQAALIMLSTDLDKIPMINNSVNDMIRRDERIMCINTIRALPSAQRWIPCSERLPESGVPVLISHVGFVTEDFLDIDELLGGAYFWNSGISLDEELNNLAWMPLPAPWKGEDDDNCSNGDSCH